MVGCNIFVNDAFRVIVKNETENDIQVVVGVNYYTEVDVEAGKTSDAIPVTGVADGPLHPLSNFFAVIFFTNLDTEQHVAFEMNSKRNKVYKITVIDKIWDQPEIDATAYSEKDLEEYREEVKNK